MVADAAVERVEAWNRGWINFFDKRVCNDDESYLNVHLVETIVSLQSFCLRLAVDCVYCCLMCVCCMLMIVSLILCCVVVGSVVLRKFSTVLQFAVHAYGRKVQQYEEPRRKEELSRT